MFGKVLRIFNQASLPSITLAQQVFFLPKEMRNKIDILFEGYSYNDPEDPSSMRANCTSTLIRTASGRNIIVDTMTAWDGERLTEALEEHQLKPQDIHHVVCTHGHADHVGCNYLFRNAEWHFVGACVSHRDMYLDWGSDAENTSDFKLDDDNVVVQRTPGHTLTCVSVIVRDTQLGAVVGVCGDLFERAEDIADSSLWLKAGSENPHAQRAQRLRMAELCEYIIPGHGGGFAVTEELREQLREQLAKCSLAS